MNLIQKLPLGLALACCMMVSSCSQEDVAEPQAGKAGTHSNLKTTAAPSIPTTAGWAGDRVFAPGWAKLMEASPDNKQLYASGTSTTTALWGNVFLPWIKPLPSPVQLAGNNSGNFVTFMAQRKVLTSGAETSSGVVTKISNLQPGKKYAVTFKFASTIRMKNGEPTQYASAVAVNTGGMIGGNCGPNTVIIDITGKEAEWVAKTIVFQAQSTEAEVYFRPAKTPQFDALYEKYLCYLHVFVPQNAVVEEVP